MPMNQMENREADTAEAMFGQLASPHVEKATAQTSALNGNVDPD